METTFSKTIRSISSDKVQHLIIIILLIAILLGLWGLWFFFARVRIYEISETARLEIDKVVHSIEAQVPGKVVKNYMVPGQEVSASDVLIELDAEIERLQLENEQTNLAALNFQLNALRNEIKAREQANLDELQTAITALEEARAWQREAEASAQFAEEEAKRKELLHERGLLPELELLQVNAEAKKRRAVAEARSLSVKLIEKDNRSKESTQLANMEHLKRDAASLEGKIATTKVTIKRLKLEIEKRFIRVPTNGTLKEFAKIEIGSVINKDEKLGLIVPTGTLKVVAEFHPAVLGRIQPGQPSRLRLEGFPWVQYGSILATVVLVANEVLDGRVCVELAVHHSPDSSIPFQHGLPGTVEIEVGRVSPATLVLNTIGRFHTTSENSLSPSKNHKGN